MLKYIEKLIQTIKLMTNFDRFTQDLTLDSVTLLAYLRYPLSEVINLGLRIEKNTSNGKGFSVGNFNPPVYPNVAIWKPDYPTSTIGRTVLAECIETEKTFGTVDSLTRLSYLATAPLILNVIVPVSYAPVAEEVLATQQIRYDNLLTFSYDNTQKRYVIENYKKGVSHNG